MVKDSYNLVEKVGDNFHMFDGNVESSKNPNWIDKTAFEYLRPEIMPICVRNGWWAEPGILCKPIRPNSKVENNR